MKEEIRRILKMLEEGKISSDEAYRLIMALKEEPKYQRKEEVLESKFGESMENFIMNVISSTFEMVGKSLSSVPVIPFMKDIGEAFLSASSIMKGDMFENLPEDFYMVHIIEGNVHVETSSDSQLEPGKYKEKHLRVPEDSKLAVAVVDGSITVEGNYKEILVHIADGDVVVKGNFDELNLNIIDGDITIYTPLDDLSVDVKIVSGDIYAEGSPRKEGNRYIYGNGRRKITGRIIDGDFKINQL